LGRTQLEARLANYPILQGAALLGTAHTAARADVPDGSASRDQAPGHSMDEEEPTSTALGGLLPEELGIWIRRRRVGSWPHLVPGVSLGCSAVRVRARRGGMAHDPLRGERLAPGPGRSIQARLDTLNEPMDTTRSGYGRHRERV
jgi:hypothetical protein